MPWAWVILAGALGASLLVYVRDLITLGLSLALAVSLVVAVLLRARRAPTVQDAASFEPLGAMIEEDLEPMEGLGTVAGGIAHEFNNLLVGILGSAHLATMERGTPASVQRHLHRIEDTGRRAGHLVHKLLATAGDPPIVAEPVRLGALVHEALDELTLPESVTLVEHVVTARATAPVDAAQVRFAVRHLVHNAMEALPAGKPGHITVRTGVQSYSRAELRKARAGSASLCAGRYAFIEVVDSGDGMDADTEMRMFDPFFSTRKPGRGLGLSAVYGIVRRHDGGLYVRTVVGQGTLVRIVLPTEPTSKPQRLHQPLPTPTGTVLLIEQDAPIQAYVRAVLRRRGLQVLVASDGVDGLAIFAQRVGAIDVVLLDVTLRDPSADAILHDIRARNPDQPVVLLGPAAAPLASSIPGHRKTGRLSKPFKVDALLDAVRPWAAISP